MIGGLLLGMSCCLPFAISVQHRRYPPLNIFLFMTVASLALLLRIGYWLGYDSQFFAYHSAVTGVIKSFLYKKGVNPGIVKQLTIKSKY